MAWQKVSITAQLKDSEVAVTVLRRVSGVASADKLLTKRGPQPLTRLDAVVHLLRADSLQVQQEAARVLGLFAQAGTDATNLIKQSASLTWSMKAALAVQLSSSTTAVRREAVNTLAQLAEHCTSIFELQQEDGVVAGLHALLDDDAVQHLAAGVLGRLAQSRSGNLAQIAGTSGVIEGLAALLSSRSTDTQLAAARALASLAEASSARQRLEEDPDIRKGLSELCRSSVLTVQQASQEALQRITGVLRTSKA
jgi:hypothetical protein